MLRFVPRPPEELMQRVGHIDEPDVEAEYDAIGQRLRARLERLLGDGWSWEGKRVLDFGCGAGRTLRHFLAEAEQAEFVGCDIDDPSIAWLQANLCPPLQAFKTNETPGLPQPGSYFDLVYAFSVFTHLSDHWAGWLLELRRVLKPRGLLLATFLSKAEWSRYSSGVWDEDAVGMNVIKKWNPWDSGGPLVFHSEWWIREHWGRAFDVLSLERSDPSGQLEQGAVLLRRRGTPADLELERPGGDPRELAAARANLEHLHEEAAELFEQLSRTAACHAALSGEATDLRSELERREQELAATRRNLEQLHEEAAELSGQLLRTAESHAALNGEVTHLHSELEWRDRELAAVAASRSWRLTAPLRATTAVLRKRRA
jgi:SAM-dependent methyltransferase